jgi:hypothetical protein
MSLVNTATPSRPEGDQCHRLVTVGQIEHVVVECNSERGGEAKRLRLQMF